MKKVTLFVGAILMLGFSSLGFAQMKTVVLDVNKMLASLPQIKTMQADLKTKFDPKGKELVGLQNTFRSDLDKYKQNNTILKGEELKKEQQKIIDEGKKLQEAKLALQRDLTSSQNQELRPILKQVEQVVTKISKDQKIDLVITKTSTAYNNPKFEITDQVITEMKKLAPSK
ncbi:MAG: OmpH family outer membrane protein [Gammaproteobacteria bacterium]|nr:OmpH family outer membrane protein [Gammaproteobacteria bacterium]